MVPRVEAAATLAGLLGFLLLGAETASSAPKIDRSPPTSPRIVGPRTTSSTRPVYSFSATDRVTSRSKLRYRCGFDTVRLHPCAARFSQRLALGRHRLRVQALDGARNKSRVTSITVDVSTHRKPGRGRRPTSATSAASSAATSTSTAATSASAATSSASVSARLAAAGAARSVAGPGLLCRPKRARLQPGHAPGALADGAARAQCAERRARPPTCAPAPTARTCS